MTKFTDEVFGILVANFKGETNETKIQGMEIKNPIISNLEKEFEVKKTKTNVRIEPLNETIIPNTGEARIWGVKYNANIVLYGRIIGSVKKKIKFFHGLL